VEKIVEHLENGKDLALVSDAGTPGISDPGNELIANLTPALSLSRRGSKELIEIIPIPGPSAITTLASVAGINMSKFSFLGFPPHKKGRETFFREVAQSKYPVIYFESPHRVLKNLELLSKFKPDAKLIVGRELTKMFEEVVRGEIEDILKFYRGDEDDLGNKGKIKGEFVIIVH
jgi:16S rRNA (cytidine1402-2'-O)-methyltransferase